MATTTLNSNRPIHVTAAWDVVTGEVIVGTSTVKGLGHLHAATSKAFHDVLLHSISPKTTVFVTDPDKRVCVLRQGKPARFLHS